MENPKLQLDMLKEARERTTPGWVWFFDEAEGVICAQKGRETCRVLSPHADVTDPDGYPTPAFRHDALLIVETLNRLDSLLEALERVMSLADELDIMTTKRLRAAQLARLEARYDLSEAHRLSGKRAHAVKEAFLREITEAFKANPAPAVSISEYYQESLTDG